MFCNIREVKLNQDSPSCFFQIMYFWFFRSLMCNKYNLIGPRCGTKYSTGLGRTGVSSVLSATLYLNCYVAIFFFFLSIVTFALLNAKTSSRGTLLLKIVLLSQTFSVNIYLFYCLVVDLACMESTACQTCVKRSPSPWSATWSVPFILSLDILHIVGHLVCFVLSFVSISFYC